MNGQRLWRQRFLAFWKEVFPYFRYVASGGLIAFLVVFTAVGGIYYKRFLENVPPEFPVYGVGSLLLLGLFVWSPVRTYVQDADLLYLMPAEHRLERYFRAGMLCSWGLQSIPLAVIWFFYWPIYRTVLEPSLWLFPALLMFFLVLKAVNTWGDWRTQQFHTFLARIGYSFLRIALNLALLYVVLRYPLLPAVGVGALALFTYVLALRIPGSYLVRWERVIEKERRHRRRIYMFLSWFSEVAQYEPKVRRRAYVDRLSSLIPFRKQSAFVYLYFKTWLRSDLYSTLWRLMLVGMLMIVVFSLDWAKGLAYVAAVYLTGVQLGSLHRYHRHMFWLHLYPLDSTLREQSGRRVTLVIHLVVTLLLSLVLCVVSGFAGWGLGLVGLMAVIMLVRYRMTRKSHTEDI